MILKYRNTGETNYHEFDRGHFSRCKGGEATQPMMEGCLGNGDVFRVVKFDVAYIMENGKTVDRISVQQGVVIS